MKLPVFVGTVTVPPDSWFDSDDTGGSLVTQPKTDRTTTPSREIRMLTPWCGPGATPESTPEALGFFLREDAARRPAYEPDEERAREAYEQARRALGSAKAPVLAGALALRFALLEGRSRRFDAQRRHSLVAADYSEIVCTTLETGRELTVGSLASLMTSSSYLAMVWIGDLAFIATTF